VRLRHLLFCLIRALYLATGPIRRQVTAPAGLVI
jgi:hypothetical protein